MQTVGTYEAKTHLSDLLDRVAKGDEVAITRNDKPIARLVPVDADAGASASARSGAPHRQSPSGRQAGHRARLEAPDRRGPALLMNFVLDCSVTMALFFEDEIDAAARALLDRASAAKVDLA